MDSSAKKANRDLLLLENKYFLEENQLKNSFNFKKKEKKNINFQTENITSNGYYLNFIILLKFNFFLYYFYSFAQS